MITKRPTFPIGYSVAGEPAIEKVLHTDDCLEIYSLASNPDLCQVLLQQRGDATASLQRWSSLSGTATKVENVVNVFDIPDFSSGVRFSVSGEHGRHFVCFQ
jgi:hypothetical protein